MSLERLKLETSNSVCMLIVASTSLQMTNCPWKGRAQGRSQVMWPIEILGLLGLQSYHCNGWTWSRHIL